MYGCESWSIRKLAPKNWCFELWCWRRLLRVPCTARRSNQSILKEINPEYSLEGLMLKLKLQYFGHLMWRTDSLEKTLMVGKIEGGRRRGRQRMRWLDGITDLMDMSPGVGDEQGGLACCSPWGHKELDTTEQLIWIEWYTGKNFVVFAYLSRDILLEAHSLIIICKSPQNGQQCSLWCQEGGLPQMRGLL